MNGFNQTMQRGREGGFLRLACDVGLILSMVLWVFAQLSLMQLAPPSGAVADVALAFLRGSVGIVLALGCAVVLPALLAMITPLTPAGMMLQETRRTTWGFAVMVAAAGFLGWYSYQIVTAFWLATLNDPTMAPMQTIATLIIAIVVPALAFSWSSPLTWLAEVQQAHQVKRLKMAHEAELAAMKAAYMRAVDKLRVGLVNLTMAERREVAGILVGMQRAQNDSLMAIAGTFRTLAGAELAVPTTTDAALVRQYDELAGLLEGRVLEVYDVPEPAADVAQAATPFDRTAAVNPRDGHVAGDAAHVDSRSQSSIPRADGSTQHDATSRHSTPPRAAEYDAALDRFGTVRVWTARDLADVLKTAESTARESITDWRRAELVDETRLGRYRFRGAA